jgi:hypothetical protein
MKKNILITSIIVAMTACAPCCWCSYAATKINELDLNPVVIDNTQMNTPDILLYGKIKHDFRYMYWIESDQLRQFWLSQSIRIKAAYNDGGIVNLLKYLEINHQSYYQLVLKYEEYKRWCKWIKK